MVHLINLQDENYENDLKKFLNNYKNHTILIDNQWNSILSFFPENFINIDKEYELNISHLFQTCVFLQQSVKYFSLSDLVKYTISREEINGSRVFDILQNIPEKHITFNSYFSSNLNIEISGLNNQLKTKTDNLIPFINFSEFGGILKKQCPGIFILILGSKILSSSFFFSEFVEVFGYQHEYPILENKFFNNFNSFKDFMKAINYSDLFSTLEQQESFQSAFNFLKNKFYITNFETIPYVVFKKDKVFCHSALIFQQSESQNTNYFYINELKIKSEEPKKREITLDGKGAELFQTSYDFYMQHVLKLKRKSINSLIIKHLNGILVNNDPINFSLISDNQSILEFINLLKTSCEISGNKILYKNSRLFIAFSSYEINRIKMHGRSLGLSKIYIANFKKFLIEEFFLRKSKLKKEVKVVY